MRNTILFFILILVSCNKTNQPLCAPPPPSVKFRLMDAQTNKDMLATGILLASEISAVNSAGKSLYVYVSNGDTMRTISVLGFDQGAHGYKLKAGEKEISFSAEVIKGDCGPLAGEMKVLGHDAPIDKWGSFVVAL
ncbi:hypothetical protein ACTJIJ_08370 [Niabella sp. 22666]|uniref:hypothetical protein n=1 Tax=Niabella sp. 22666 TaxID=3453954 RepID=UPI003F8267C4